MGRWKVVVERKSGGVGEVEKDDEKYICNCKKEFVKMKIRNCVHEKVVQWMS